MREGEGAEKAAGAVFQDVWQGWGGGGEWYHDVLSLEHRTCEEEGG